MCIVRSCLLVTPCNIFISFMAGIAFVWGQIGALGDGGGRGGKEHCIAHTPGHLTAHEKYIILSTETNNKILQKISVGLHP